MAPKKKVTSGKTTLNGKGKGRIVVTEEDVKKAVEEEKAVMLRARQTELDQVVDVHDNLVRLFSSSLTAVILMRFISCITEGP